MYIFFYLAYNNFTITTSYYLTPPVAKEKKVMRNAIKTGFITVLAAIVPSTGLSAIVGGGKRCSENRVGGK
jgi:hypothetical protein